MSEIYDLDNYTPYLVVREDEYPRIYSKLGTAKARFGGLRWNDKIPGSAYGGSGTMTHPWGTIYVYGSGKWEPFLEIPQPQASDLHTFRKRGSVVMAFETRPWRL